MIGRATEPTADPSGSLDSASEDGHADSGDHPVVLVEVNSWRRGFIPLA